MDNREMDEKETTAAVDVGLEEYTAAFLIAGRRRGLLVSPWLAAALMAAMALLGMGSLQFFARPELCIATVLCFFGGVVLTGLIAFWQMPRRLKKQAGDAYLTYDRLMAPLKVIFQKDQLVAVSPCCRITEPYALFQELVETPQLLIFLKDREWMLVIPKRRLPPDPAFLQTLRLIFVRHRRVMKNWLF